MPELPEVETIKEILKPIFVNRKITNVEVLYSPIIKSPKNEFVASLVNVTVTDIKRIGKFLIFCLSNDKVLISHLRMEGKYILLRDDELKTQHSCIIFHLDDGKRVCYDDSRKFGIMQIENAHHYLNIAPINKVGIEPIALHHEDEYNKIYQLIRRQKKPIKAVLLDQSILAGLGNIYVDETLFMTKIHPETPANLLSYEEVISIIKNASQVLLKAISFGGSTIKSYHPNREVDGHFQEELLCYGKSGEPCPHCGNSLRKIFVIGRGTTYCPHCQKNRKLPYVLGITGVIASGKSVATSYLQSRGCETISSDEIVHELYSTPEVIERLEKTFKTALKSNSVIDRQKLSELVLIPKNKKKLEQIIHPLVEEKLVRFIKFATTKIVVLEVPLLFEARLDYLCDATIAIIVHKEQQIANLKKRGIADVEQYLSLNSTNQFSEYKEKVTYLLNSNNDLEKLYKLLDEIMGIIKKNLNQ